MMQSVDVRARLVETLRRDLIGPGPQDADLRDERLKENPVALVSRRLSRARTRRRWRRGRRGRGGGRSAVRRRRRRRPRDRPARPRRR